MRKIIFKLLIAVFTLLTVYIYVSNVYVLPWEKEEAIQATLDMGGLNKLPEGIKNLTIEKSGSFFTRQYIIEFELDDVKKIDNWIE